MKKPFIFILTFFLLIVGISVISTLIFYDEDEKNNITDNINKVIITKEKGYETVDKTSPNISIYDVDKDKVIKMDIEEYLYGVLSSEMPSTFDIEALKAQAIAARTYVIYKRDNNITSGHKNAVVCTNSAHCQAYSSYETLKKVKGEDWIKSDYNKVKEAVDDTKGQIVVYDGKPILPLYFSTSSGKTENSQDVFSSEYPYLVSVDSPYEEKSPKYKTIFKIKKATFIKNMKRYYPKLNLSLKNINNQVKILNRTSGGCVKTIQVGNIKLRGTELRKALNLNSANFTIRYSGDTMEFIVKGYGHGVGLSQWGAQGMAEKGYKYYDILLHYYKNTDIKDLY